MHSGARPVLVLSGWIQSLTCFLSFALIRALTLESPIPLCFYASHMSTLIPLQAVPGVAVHICDPEGKPLPVGTEGEIVCVGPNVRSHFKQLQPLDS